LLTQQQDKLIFYF